MNKQEIEKAIGIINRDIHQFKKLLIEQPNSPVRDRIESEIFAYEVAISALEHQLTDMWIPVSERMPEFDQNCLVTADDEEIYTSKFYGYGEECQGFREYPDGVWEINQCELEALAWRPLPEPWKETV